MRLRPTKICALYLFFVITTPLILRKYLIKSKTYDSKCTRVSCDICDKTNSKNGW